MQKFQRKFDGQKEWSHDWNVPFAAMLEAADVSVGHVRAKLKELGLEENTLFVFSSDNGGPAGITISKPLKGAKGALFEGGVRVPTSMVWPAVIKPGTVCDTPITSVDFMPTFAEMAGAKLPQFSDHSTGTYQENMAHFIRDVRKDLKSPKLPFVIGAMGHGGTNQKGTTKALAEAQIATAQIPEFNGNVITVKTADFWDYDAAKAFENKKQDPVTWGKLGSNQGYHYFGSAAFFEKTGTAFAEAIIELWE